MGEERVELVEAALRLRMSYERALRLVFRGLLRGERTEDEKGRRRWMVDAGDLARYIAEREGR